MTFNPKNFGNYSTCIDLTLLNEVYKIPIKVAGTCGTTKDKQKKVRGIECLP